MDIAQMAKLGRDELVAINRCRCYGHILFLSDISTADGTLIEDTFLTGPFTPLLLSFTFPPEEPTSLDWMVWHRLLQSWPSLTSQHGITLGQWRHAPHHPWRWYFDAKQHTVYEQVQDTFMVLQHAPGRTRLESSYCYTGQCADSPSGLPASVQIIQVGQSWRVLTPVTGPSLPSEIMLSLTFWDTLRRWGGEWMWTSLFFDNGTSNILWIADSFREGNLIGVADGSNDRIRSPHVSGTGWILCDKVSRRTLAGNFTEVSASGSSYWGEVLGLCAMHVLVLTIETHFGCSSTSGMTIFCDNEVTVDRANQVCRRIKPRWACGDVLRSFHNICQRISTALTFEYVESHINDHIPWNDMTLPQQLNCQCDHLAKQAIKERFDLSRKLPWR